ncbi:MAG: hypothetical protein HYS65_15500 [Betaproteobacteria bacterium]|nr:hypothetical protein [Betaproteobacteria bacterium]
MIAALFIRRSLLSLWLALVATTVFAQAQPAQKPFEPQVGQEGKDVIWVPTPQALVDKMMDMAKVTANDYVIDLGSGDGRTVITAAKRSPSAARSAKVLPARPALRKPICSKAIFRRRP